MDSRCLRWRAVLVGGLAAIMAVAAGCRARDGRVLADSDAIEAEAARIETRPAAPSPAVPPAEPPTTAQEETLVTPPLPPGPAPAGESRLIDTPDQVVTVLDSGMTVIVARYPAAPVVSVRMHVRAGSVWEDNYAGAGISHLFEHLLHRGATDRRSEDDSRLLLERIGASTNAFTTYDQTVYFIDCPAGHAPVAIDLLADWVTRPTFPADGVARELGVVQRELERGLDEPDRQLWYKVSELRYLRSPGRFPVIGLKAAVARLTRDDIVAYYRRMYIPARVVFAVVGDIDVQATLETVKKNFADFTARPDQPIVLPPEPPVSAPRSLVYPMDVAQVRFCIGFPTVSLFDEDLYPLDVAAYVLAAGESSRLTRELRDRRKLALSIYASSYTPAWADGAFTISGLCEPGRWPELRKAILDEFARLIDQPIDAEALAQAKRQALVGHIRSRQTAGDLAGELASNQLRTGDAHFGDAYVRRLGLVTAEQVQAAARKYFLPDRLLSVLVAPRGFGKARAPGEAHGAGEAQQSPGIAIPGLSGRTQSAGAEPAFAVSPIRKVTLDNGLTVLLRRNAAVPLVAVQMHFKGGLLGEPANQVGVCRLMSLAELRGTKTRTADQVFEAFERAGGTLDSASGRNSFSFSASVLADQLDAALPVFADVVLHPAFPDDEVAQLKARTVAAIDRIDDRLQSQASRFFFAKYFGSHPYGHLPLGEKGDVAKLTSADLAAFHDRFVVGPNAVLAVFGDIDLDRTEARVRELFAALPSAQRFQMPVVPAPKAPEQNRFEVQKTALAEAAEVDIGYPGVTYDSPDYYPLTILDTITSGYGLPGGWLHETLRGRQLVYVVHAQNIAWRQPGVFYIFAQCQPGKVKEVLAGIEAQMQRARRGEFTETELVQARARVLAAELLDNQTNDALAARCAIDELLGRGYDHYRRLAESLNAVSMEDVRRVARQYLTFSVTTVTTGQPEAAD